MDSADGEHDTNQYPQEVAKDHHGRSIPERIAEFGLYTIFVFGDVHTLWEKHRILALIIAVAGLGFLLIIDKGFSRKTIARTLAGAAVVASLAYFSVPEAVTPDVEVHGTILPGAAPQTDCEKKVLAASTATDTINVLLANFGASIPGIKFLQVLSVGSCSVLSVTMNAGMLGINADLYDGAGKLVARMQDNAFTAIQGEQSTIDRNHDLTQFVVKSGSGEELLHVEF